MVNKFSRTMKIKVLKCSDFFLIFFRINYFVTAFINALNFKNMYASELVYHNEIGEGIMEAMKVVLVFNFR